MRKSLGAIVASTETPNTLMRRTESARQVRSSSVVGQGQREDYSIDIILLRYAFLVWFYKT